MTRWPQKLPDSPCAISDVRGTGVFTRVQDAAARRPVEARYLDICVRKPIETIFSYEEKAADVGTVRPR